VLHLIPAPLHRALLRLAHALRTRWWRIARPYLRGCRIVALDAKGHVLLVRHAYGSGAWMTPGGGLARGEAPVAGAVRELREETGCILDDPVEVALSEEPMHGAVNGVHVVAGRTASTPRADGREIVEARFFPAAALPSDMPPMLRAQLPAWITAATIARPDDDPLGPGPPLPATKG
jgi:8-oxo-dGTP pyrophosphatase MutT (NUDIX family)